MRYKRLLYGLLTALCVFAVYSFNSDDDIITKIQQRLDDWENGHPVEKVHLQLDKPYYTAGEDIWFKAYVTIGSAHQLSAYSGVLNVELIDDRDSVKQNLKLPLNNGVAWGDFALPDTIHEGNYRIRAYTQYMLNAGAAYLFNKTISIGNVITNKVFTQTTFEYTDKNGSKQVNATITYTDANGVAYVGNTADYNVIANSTVIAKGKSVTDSEGKLRFTFTGDDAALLRAGRIVTGLSLSKQNVVRKSIPVRVMASQADVQFFPEGGSLVSNIPTKVAFKAIGSNGLGMDIKGFITDNNGNQLATINTTHLGMGVFNLLPQPGTTYKAQIEYPDGSKASVPLPQAVAKGSVLNIATESPDVLRLTVSTAPGTFANEDATQLNLVAQSAGKIYYAAKSKPGKDVFSAIIPKNKFPSGIVQFTLFSASGEPLNERLVLIQNPDQLNVTVSPQEQTAALRQKVKLIINAKNKDGKPAIGSFSVAVTDETRVPVDENNENNIMANLLLTSDIKGYVEQPAYYFNNISEKTRADLDVLMLTQGYHRYEWKQIMNADAKTPLAYPRETTFQVSGTVTTQAGKPVVGGKVQLINLDDGVFNLDTLTDAQGRFAFKNLSFEDSVRFFVQARTAKKKKDVVIKFDTIAPPATSGYKNAADFQVNVSSGISAYALNNKLFYAEQLKYGLGNHVISLKEVQIRDKREAFKNSQNLNGPGNADQVLVAKDFANLACVRIMDCLQGRLVGVMVRNGIPYSTRSNGGPMQIILDGMYLDADVLNSLNINDIQSIEVLRSSFYASIYGGRAANGVIVITTKRGDDRSYTPDIYGSGVKAYYPKGFYKARTFYSPQYDNKTNDKLADLRTTVYWKPNIITDDAGNATIEYFNAGKKGNYRVVIEGIDGDGNIGRQVYRYKVE